MFVIFKTRLTNERKTYLIIVYLIHALSLKNLELLFPTSLLLQLTNFTKQLLKNEKAEILFYLFFTCMMARTYIDVDDCYHFHRLDHSQFKSDELNYQGSWNLTVQILSPQITRQLKVSLCV